ncbi:MAG: HIT family protein [Candidatus Pristimantibacillus lignocellulolyticus]|uniref:HIT family protein n=1 Tax=Candidatus Pristimantibacillus lignocellulolyticus TaxID=2994561 RepID=A0A9J6ZC97_9BACL|nr:MAG: HIT family protein [Candidatus Pristimantibacillus lignocellulolyticus]
MNCLGCKLANQLLETNVVFEDDSITCVLDIDPLNEGHTLILPKKHFKDLEEIDETTIKSIINASVIISNVLKGIYQPDGISIIQNGGIFNDLEHYHMHVFPRYKDDGFGWVEPINKSEIKLNEVKMKMIEELRVEVKPKNSSPS